MRSLQFFLIVLALPVALAVSTTIVTVTAAPAPASTSFVNDTTFKNDMLVAHNFYRAEHGVKNLTWNDTSAKTGAEYSLGCVFEHSNGPTGENLAAGYPNATASIDAWGIERLLYDFKKPTGFTEATGHFTAMVWSNTTSVGCGRTNCNGRNKTPGYYVVCEYFPAGNVVGNNNQYFKDNVRAQLSGNPTDTVEDGVNVTTISTAATTTAASAGGKVYDERWGSGVLVAVVLIGVGLSS